MIKSNEDLPAESIFEDDQAQAPEIRAANGEEKATCFLRASDSKESLNDPPAPVAESSPWRPASASLPFTFFDTHYQFTGRWFRQITPLVIRNARSLGTNAIPKAPRFVHALGALDPMSDIFFDTHYQVPVSDTRDGRHML